MFDRNMVIPVEAIAAAAPGMPDLTPADLATMKGLFSWSPMRYRLRTLLIALAVGPPALGGLWLARSSLLPAGILIAAILFVAIGSALAAVLATMALVWILQPLIFVVDRFRSALRRRRRTRIVAAAGK